MPKHFQRNNQPFVCEHCQANVPAHPTSSRDHCNNCLYGKHVDNYPGDRANNCQGTLIPIGLDIKNGKTQIVFRCQKCGQQIKNIQASDDNPDKVVLLAQKAW